MLRLLFLSLLLCSLSAVVAAQTNTATVTGADKLVVRRGPGKQFPPFASLTDGSKVEVEQIEGEWARIVTGNGQRGYVHSNFLALSGDAPQAPTAGAAAPEAPAPAPAETEPTAGRAASDRSRALEADLKTATDRKKALEAEARTAGEHAKTLEAELKTATERTKSLEAETAALTERSKGLEAELQSTRQALTDLKNRPLPTAAAHESPAAPKARIDDVQAELVRLTAAVESLQTRLGSGPGSNAAAGGGVASVTPSDNRSDDVFVSTTAILLGLVGIVVGWALSGAFGRKQDRGKRARIRF